jgi:hypothetical protein
VSPRQIQLSASSRGITDHFFYFTCDEYVWDCDHLVEERISASRIAALEGNQLQSFAYDGKSRVLEIEFRVTAPFIHSEIPLPPPPRVIQYFDVPRYVFTKLIRCKAGRRQEIFRADVIRTRFRCQTVRTVCRVPRVYRLHEARNLRRFQFEEYMTALAEEERQALRLVVTAMKLLLLKTLSPRRAAGLGGLMQCRCCAGVGTNLWDIRHKNCLWLQLHS